MANVRVYELAKEAGLDSKTMVARLAEWGYEVKSHSSSVSEAQANEIRVKLGLVETKIEKKRIEAKGRTTIIRRRRKVVVPPSAPEPRPAAAEEEAPSPAGDAAAPAQEPAPEPTPAGAPEGDAAPETAVVAPESAPEPAAGPLPPAAATGKEQAPPAAEDVPPAAGTEAAGPPSGEEGEAVADAPGAEGVEQPDAPQPATPARPRKGAARVIARAAIKIEEPREEPVRRPARPKPSAGAAAAPAAPAKGKKGKRYVRFQAEPEGRDRGRRAGAKRKSRIVVDVDDVAELDAALPAGLRIGRTSRGGGKKKKAADRPAEAAGPKAVKRRIKVTEVISVGDLARRMGVKASEVIAKLMTLGVMATVNKALDVDTAALVADEFGYEVEQGMTEEQVIEQFDQEESGGEELPRPPVVTVMGHVDHGKTSILDAIRQTDVVAGEAGGITQHIGAHYVRSAQGDVVFLDTPGHEAFTAMRSRGAQVTDIVVLVVAADDGVMDQTKEAINHAKAAGVPIVVAVNKIDKPDADPQRVMRELAEYDLIPEEWGGQTIFVQTSAKQKTGIDDLLEQILLQAEILELKADPNRKAKGTVIEAQLHKGRGPIATILVQQGTLRVGDAFVVGLQHGKVRAMFNDRGQRIKEAGPSVPVEVQGLSGVPQAGDEFMVVKNEKMAKSISHERQLRAREAELAKASKISLDNLFDKLKEGEAKELRVLLRADVQGTLEAFSASLEKLSTDEVRIRVLHAGTGTITDSDVLLAAASDAVIIGFNVRPSAKVAELAKKENVEIRYYDVIYHALEDVKKAMTGLLEPTYEEKVLGSVEVRDTFQVPRVGTIAGCYVTDGVIQRNARVRVVRDGVVVYTGRVASLKRFKDDVREVAAGYECGVGIENFNDIKVGDVFEVFALEEVAAEL